MKVASRDGVRMVNSYKKYLAVESHCDDFVPPVLEQHEDILIQYGNKLRVGQQPGQPPIRKVVFEFCR